MNNDASLIKKAMERLKSSDTSDNVSGALRQDKLTAIQSQMMKLAEQDHKNDVHNADQWVDIGIVDTSVKDIPSPDIHGEDDFKKVPENEMREGLLKLQEMKAEIDAGPGQSKDYWQLKDEAAGRDYQHGYQRIYEAFYGLDCIRVTTDNNQYDVINGRHRIWLAKQMGIDVLPIRVIKRQDS